MGGPRTAWTERHSTTARAAKNADPTDEQKEAVTLDPKWTPEIVVDDIADSSDMYPFHITEEPDVASPKVYAALGQLCFRDGSCEVYAPNSSLAFVGQKEVAIVSKEVFCNLLSELDMHWCEYCDAIVGEEDAVFIEKDEFNQGFYVCSGCYDAALGLLFTEDGE